MNLTNFHEHIEPKILERAKTYYIEDNIKELVLDDNTWTAEVSGSVFYAVTIKLDESGNILDSDCDCPYEFGEYCKHKTAVLYCIRDIISNNKVDQYKNKDPKINLDSVLNSVSKEELINFLNGMAKRNKGFREEILIRFNKNNNDILKNAKNIIKTSVNNATKYGFVDYYDMPYAISGAENVLEIAKTELENGNFINCAKLCVLLIEEMAELGEMGDDSNGETVEIMESSLELLKDISKRAIEFEYNLKEQIFNIIFEEAPEYYENEFIELCIPFCSNQEFRVRIEEYLSRYINNSDDYDSKKRQNIQYEIILQFDGREMALDYAKNNIINSNFREIIIHNLIDNNELDEALKLCLEGEKLDINHRMHLELWKNLRYSIYEKQNNIPAQKILALEFAQDGNFDYFLKLKNLCTSSDWSKILEDLLYKIKEDTYLQGFYTQILINEKLKNRLLEYCQNHCGSILRFYRELLPEYKEEMVPLFLDYIEKATKETASRRHYSDVCKVIEKFKNACGEVHAKNIKLELLNKYPKRRALIDELSNISF